MDVKMDVKEELNRQEEKTLKRWKEDFIDLTSYIYRKYCWKASHLLLKQTKERV